jgi:hypothetical protein
MNSDIFPIIFSILLLVALISLITFLLWKGKIKSTAFTVLLPTVCMIAFLYFGFNRIKEFDAKNLKVTLNEMKQVKEDTYAKAETVRVLSREIAELALVTAQMSPATIDVSSNGLISVNSPTPEQLIAIRDHVVRVLESAGSPADQVARASTQMNDFILKSLKGGTWLQFCEYRPDDQPAVEQGVKRLLIENYDRKALTEFLKSKNRWKDEFNQLLDAIDKFIREKQF